MGLDRLRRAGGSFTQSAEKKADRRWLSTLYTDSGDPEEVADLVEMCEELLYRLPLTGVPKGVTPSNDLDVLKLVDFLSNEWLDDEQQEYTPLDAGIQSGNVRALSIPLSVKRGTHWALLQHGLARHTYSYADGELEPPKRIFDLITWWLGSIDPNYLTPTRASFPVPLPAQADGSSCGIIAPGLPTKWRF
ncbi:hypothetical protein FA13DRAFT_1711583 [Coprinellus micaceus]|uniref:Ubiquitin-like protease family profile domain-containing protein n=1 Tax=Coprinellus micaceus TaxID=71717 RepID=A0A4Y7T453_COPMI|nr:hypothetical protein FA13DRAFT_1711583 [Coprinellus micaceus]